MAWLLAKIHKGIAVGCAGSGFRRNGRGRHHLAGLSGLKASLRDSFRKMAPPLAAPGSPHGLLVTALLRPCNIARRAHSEIEEEKMFGC